MKRNKSKVIYDFFVVVLYLVFGTLLLLKYLVWQEVPDTRMGIFGGIVLSYAVFRGIRAYRNSKMNNEESRND